MQDNRCSVSHVPSLRNLNKNAKVKQIAPEKPEEAGIRELQDHRISLEKDVVDLRKKLTEEINLRQALNRGFHRPLGTLPRITAQIPGEVRELLFEVALLEEENVYLERHAGSLRKKLEKESELSSPSTKLVDEASVVSNPCMITKEELREGSVPPKPTNRDNKGTVYTQLFTNKKNSLQGFVHIPSPVTKLDDCGSVPAYKPSIKTKERRESSRAAVSKITKFGDRNSIPGKPLTVKAINSPTPDPPESRLPSGKPKQKTKENSKVQAVLVSSLRTNREDRGSVPTKRPSTKKASQESFVAASLKLSARESAFAMKRIQNGRPTRTGTQAQHPSTKVLAPADRMPSSGGGQQRSVKHPVKDPTPGLLQQNASTDAGAGNAKIKRPVPRLKHRSAVNSSSTTARAAKSSLLPEATPKTKKNPMSSKVVPRRASVSTEKSRSGGRPADDYRETEELSDFEADQVRMLCGQIKDPNRLSEEVVKLLGNLYDKMRRPGSASVSGTSSSAPKTTSGSSTSSQIFAIKSSASLQMLQELSGSGKIDTSDPYGLEQARKITDSGPHRHYYRGIRKPIQPKSEG